MLVISVELQTKSRLSAHDDMRVFKATKISQLWAASSVAILDLLSRYWKKVMSKYNENIH